MVGLRGPSSREAMRLSTANTIASTSITKIGRYWATGSGLHAVGFGVLEVLAERLVPVVQDQDEHHEEREADHEVRAGQEPDVAQVTHEHDRDDRLVRVDHRDGRRRTWLGRLRDDLLHLD